MSIYENIEALLRKNALEEAAASLDSMLAETPDDARAWYLRGRVWWRKGERTRAMTCYSHAVAIDPDSPAAIALAQAGDIADFFNPDLLNP